MLMVLTHNIMILLPFPVLLQVKVFYRALLTPLFLLGERTGAIVENPRGLTCQNAIATVL